MTAHFPDLAHALTSLSFLKHPSLAAFILHFFYLSSQMHWLDKCLFYSVTDQNIAFLVPDSCWATVRNCNCINADSIILYIVGKCKINLHSLRNSIELEKLVQINYVFSDNIRVLSICRSHINDIHVITVVKELRSELFCNLPVQVNLACLTYRRRQNVSIMII